MSPVRFHPADRAIFGIAAPALVALVSEPLMLLADTAIVGHLGTIPLAGLAIASTAVTAVVGLCVFLAYGSTAAVARSRGSGDLRAADEMAVSSLWLAGALGFGLAATIWALSRWFTSTLASSSAVAGQAHAYLEIIAGALPAMLLMLAATGALRGERDLRAPMVVTVLANLANIVLNLTFVYGLGWGIRGSAIGTTLASWGSALWLAGIVAVRARRAGARIGPHPAGVLRAARDGVPLFVRTVTLRVALFLPVVIAARLGDAPLAAHQIAMSVVTVLAYGLDSIAIAGQTLTGHALGSGDAAGTRQLSRRMMGWGVVIGVVAGMLVAALSPAIAVVFTPDPGVRSVLRPVLLVIAAIQPVSGVVFVLDGILIGAGDSRYLARAGLVTLGAYIPLALALSQGGFTWLWVAYGGFMAVRLITLVLRERSDRWMVLGGGGSPLP